MFSAYFSRFGFLPPHIQQAPHPDTALIIVIPCFQETGIDTCLQSLLACHTGAFYTEVIVVINEPENAPAEVTRINNLARVRALSFQKKMQERNICLYVPDYPPLPKLHAGVGLARKIGMDEAAARFSEIGNTSGVIVCFDADSTCSENYLTEIYAHFKNCPLTPGASLYFEHPLSGTEYPEEIYAGIYSYELHLRYYRQALAYTGFPYAFHTIGSSMAVRASVYMQQGGMNKRKAGEDFYFLQKIMPLGQFSEIQSLCVYPSPRSSHRVPFGTGKAISDMLQKQTTQYLSPNIQSFIVLKKMFAQIFSGNLQYESIPLEVKEYISKDYWDKKRNEIEKNARNSAQRNKRFFQWFDALEVLKFLHFMRSYFPDKPSDAAAWEFAQYRNWIKGEEKNLLLLYRKKDRDITTQKLF